MPAIRDGVLVIRDRIFYEFGQGFYDPGWNSVTADGMFVMLFRVCVIRDRMLDEFGADLCELGQDLWIWKGLV